MSIPSKKHELAVSPSTNGHKESDERRLSDLECQTLARYYQAVEMGKVKLQMLQEALNSLVVNALAARGLSAEEYQVTLDTGAISPRPAAEKP